MTPVLIWVCYLYARDYVTAIDCKHTLQLIRIFQLYDCLVLITENKKQVHYIVHIERMNY